MTTIRRMAYQNPIIGEGHACQYVSLSTCMWVCLCACHVSTVMGQAFNWPTYYIDCKRALSILYALIVTHSFPTSSKLNQEDLVLCMGSSVCLCDCVCACVCLCFRVFVNYCVCAFVFYWPSCRKALYCMLLESIATFNFIANRRQS